MLKASQELQLPWSRTTGAASNTALGSQITAFQLGFATTGGFYASPFRIPPDFDRTRPAHLFGIIFKPSGALVPAGDIALRLDSTVATPTAAAVDTFSFPFIDIPDNWPNQLPIFQDLEDPTDPLFPPHSIPDQAIIGLRIARLGTDPSDNWTGNLGIVTTLVLQYAQTCRSCCCP